MWNNEIANKTYQYLDKIVDPNVVLKNFEHSKSSNDIFNKIIEINNLENNTKNVSIIKESIKKLIDNSIEIPKIKIFPKNNIDLVLIHLI